MFTNTVLESTIFWWSLVKRGGGTWELWLPGCWGRCWGGRHLWWMAFRASAPEGDRACDTTWQHTLVNTWGADLYSKPEYPQQGKNTAAGWTSQPCVLKAARCSPVLSSAKLLAALVVCQTLQLFQTSLHRQDENLCQSAQHDTSLLMAKHLFICKGRLNSWELLTEIMVQYFSKQI